MRRWIVVTCAVLASAAGVVALEPAASPRAIADSVRDYRRAHEAAIVSELTSLLALPNIAADAADMHRNAALLKAMLERRGVSVRFLDVKDRGPIIIGSLPAPGATRTLVFYAHYDGQPVDPAAWSGTKPFEPALRTASIAAGGQLRPFPPAGTPQESLCRLTAACFSTSVWDAGSCSNLGQASVVSFAHMQTFGAPPGNPELQNESWLSELSP